MDNKAHMTHCLPNGRKQVLLLELFDMERNFWFRTENIEHKMLAHRKDQENKIEGLS